MNNPLNIINDTLNNQQFKASVLNSLLWAVDTMTINTIRQTLYQNFRRRQDEGGIDSYNEYINALDELRADNRFMQNCGLQPRLDDLQSLMSFANDIDDELNQIAITAATFNSNLRRQPRKTYEQLLADERPREVSIEEEQRYAMIVGEVSMDEEDRKTNLELLKRNAAESNRRMHEQNSKLNPSISAVLHDLAPHTPTRVFSDMSKEVQERLTQSALRIIRSTRNRAASWRSIDTSEFMSIMAECKLALMRLDTVRETEPA